MAHPFCSYCDEFGHPDDPRKKYMGIAGLLGRSESWLNFDKDWKSICDQESIPNPFHMTDFVHQSEKFKNGWESEDSRMRVLLRLLQAIKKADVMPIAASIVLEDYRNLTADQRSRLRSPYYIAFQEVTFNIAHGVAKNSLTSYKEADNCLNGQVAMVYAKLKKFTGPAEELWNALKTANPLVAHWMGSYTPADPANVTPLQAADIWAYCLGHMGEHHPPKKKEAEVAFDCFKQMALKHLTGHKFFTLFDRREMLDRLGET